jgi:hypothetical protein
MDFIRLFKLIFSALETFKDIISAAKGGDIGDYTLMRRNLVTPG